MLGKENLQALAQARHHDPFAVLGMHADGGGDPWVRSPLPGARRVVPVDTRTGQRVAALRERRSPARFAADAHGLAPFDGTALLEARMPPRGCARIGAR